MSTPDLVLHPITATAVQGFIANPAHAAVLVGPAGSGKMTLSRHISAQLLGITHTQLDTFPYFKPIMPVDGKALSIDEVRGLQQWMSLRIPGAADGINRVAVIVDAHLLTTEAQNALLKTLEEPPSGTVVLLTASAPEALLPTIQSRARMLHVQAPPLDLLKQHYTQAGHDEASISKALMVSAGLPGLTHALLTAPEDHPLYEATRQARALLQSSAYDRLALVDGLSKQRQLALDTIFILGHMARMALVRAPDMAAKSAERWQNILRVSYDADRALRRNGQAKLVLTDLMLQL